MMILDQIKLSQGIIGYPKDEYQLVVHLFMLIVVILWSIMHCYGHFYHYGSYKNGSFMIFFYLIGAYDSLLYALVILKSSVPTLETPPTLSIAGVQSLPAAHCAYAPYTSSTFCSIYHPWTWIYNIFYINCMYLYYKFVHLPMDLHPNTTPQVITGHHKHEYQLVIYLFVLILLILWCNIHWYYHYFYYEPYNKWKFILFLYFNFFNKLMHLMMFSHQNTVSQFMIGHPKDKHQLVLYLFMLIVVNLWCILHWYCHYCYYGPHNYGDFICFLNLINLWELLFYIHTTSNQSVQPLDIPTTQIICRSLL